ncbi:PREDICTED: organic cation/carnitine transporter 3-like isoform X2 [Ipomoea nil]|uniref:organic cation/carnitine transporter 3-like isoform X2 n=1 Tax=Ipomoea nil TaxID=35883 RepID=UPI000901482F|nr:PREDICTED: organic cation/carnitine transporter 3-like isoform X2 [Ipomoea nil]
MLMDQHPEKNPLLILPTTNDERKNRTKRSLDDTIEVWLGRFSWAQFLQATLANFAWVFDAQQTFVTVFTDLVPTWHCNSTSSSPLCSPAADNNVICELPEEAWAWDAPPQTSVVSEWGLQCAGAVITGLPATSYFVGCLVGGLALSTLADASIGRKKMLAFSCFLMNVAAVVTAAATNVWVYSSLRFLTGFARATIGTCALVLSTEIVGRRWRGQVGIIGFVCFTLGFLSLPAMAYFNAGSSWRYLYLFTGIPGIIYSVIVYLVARESPRWLYLRGLTQDFVFSDNQDQGLIDLDEQMDLYSALKLLINKGWALRRLLTVMWVALGIGLVYYGIPLGVGEMPFNLYLSTTLNAVSELPASLVTLLLIDKLRRRSTVVGLGVLSGVCNLGCVVFVGEELKAVQIGLEIVAFFTACTAFNILLIYTLELFPTCVRNSAVAMARQAMVVGGAISPLLVALGRGNRFYSYGVFGLASVLCCLFLVSLPETLGGDLCDTIDEEESKENGNRV